MNGDSSVMKCVEIVPGDNFRSCVDSSNISSSPCHVKVCFNAYLLCLLAQLYNWACNLAATGSNPGHAAVSNRSWGKLFTHICLCH